MPGPGRTDTASRLVAAAPDAVYAALLDAGALMAWLPPRGMTGRALLFEPWEGGRYRIELSLDGPSDFKLGGNPQRLGNRGDKQPRGKTTAKSDVSAGRFVSLEPGRRVVQSVAFDSDDPAFAGEMIMTWSLAPAPGGTAVTVTAENVPAGISAQDHAAGLASSLDNLARFLGKRRGESDV